MGLGTRLTGSVESSAASDAEHGGAAGVPVSLLARCPCAAWFASSRELRWGRFPKHGPVTDDGSMAAGIDDQCQGRFVACQGGRSWVVFGARQLGRLSGISSSDGHNRIGGAVGVIGVCQRSFTGGPIPAVRALLRGHGFEVSLREKSGWYRSRRRAASKARRSINMDLWRGPKQPPSPSDALRGPELVADRQIPDPLAGGVVDRVH